MSDVPETLQQLVDRRLREMGKDRGRREPLSLREAYLAIKDEERKVGYEVLRRVKVGTHHNIGDDAADTLATMLHVPVADVLVAARKRPRLGRFELPREADRLDEHERKVVVSVVEAILAAGERGLGAPEAAPTAPPGLSPAARAQALEIVGGAIERGERQIEQPARAAGERRAARRVTRKGYDTPGSSD